MNATWKIDVSDGEGLWTFDAAEAPASTLPPAITRHRHPLPPSEATPPMLGWGGLPKAATTLLKLFVEVPPSPPPLVGSVPKTLFSSSDTSGLPCGVH
ncbi:hypothetical protein GUJ93_ZPchr0009g2176 [Zizania palustris]|uniref:Uncharacterized protein n=1 Tax=Zizania palustris TaxID=103762 RepID=A0A8J5V7V8_ZIZPA|nr:hypothetical protein GUJ93_ZPchr0009g2176 [Zizania palustris]